ncbi:MAG: LysM peptidoglycan-binding domain-containing protein [Chloroflexi bacterium]|nr:LysM peptidoglycan-binding domain-containing protein [Chloroflexota bacterium]
MRQQLSRLAQILALVALTLLLAPSTFVHADQTPEDCLDGEWEVRPLQTLYFIAFQCGVTVDDLVAANGIENPNLIFTGQILTIPLSGAPVPPAAPPAGGEPPAAPENPVTPPPPVSNTGGVQVTIGDPLYAGDGRIAEVQITVTNTGVPQGIAGGRYYPPVPGQDGPSWVTLFKAEQNEGSIAYPAVYDNAPLWRSNVTLDNGQSFPVYAGCMYREEVFAQGDEPDHVTGTWYHWEITLTGGWFDCGNEFQVKPEDIFVGQTGSAPLRVYLVHPRLWNEVFFGSARISSIDVEIFDINGVSLGVVASRNF